MLLLIPAIMLIQQAILYLANLNLAIIDTSNHVDTTSNLISANLNLAIIDTSNHVDTTSNLISANLNQCYY